ncbi:MAG: hypothetical protein E7231_07320 [Cellulosilyticum sp.]|nr:hypothetical protein [Cellulosilyticum sp.]
MKVTLLLAQCTSELLQHSVQIITNVLQELEVEIHRVELHKLPYFEGSRTRQMDSIMASVEASDGIIAISAVPMLGMHAAMQSFFDHATLYDMKCFSKPMMVVTYSDWLGEQEAAQMMLKCWEILGGMDGGATYMNKSLPSNLVLERIEKEVENFYRLMKQERPNIGSSQRMLYYNIKRGRMGIGFETPIIEERKPEIRNFADIVREDSFIGRMQYHKDHTSNTASAPVENVSKEESSNHRIDLSTKEQTIKEIAQLIEKESSGESFKSMQSGVYTRPPQVFTTNISTKRLQQIPHYFTAQYDKELSMVLKYQVTDIEEKGYVVIRDGDCIFVEQIDEVPTVEMSLTEEVLNNILSKKITYQKAFMLGKLKVKGNFSILPKLDQVFKAL